MSPRNSSEYNYEPLREFLAGQLHQNKVSLTFKEIEVLLGDSLPEPAYSSSAGWWTVSDSPQSRAWLEAGFGLSLVAHQTDTSGWVEFVRGLQRWSGVVVDSKQFGQKPFDERLHELALGYLQSAKLLCILLGEHPNELSWPRASVVCFCYQLAVELFLKSCILHRIPAIEKCSHDISKLKKEYSRLYSQQEFHFETPYDISLDDLDELFGVQVAHVEDFERKHDQVFRYLSDKMGRSPKGIYVFAPGSWLTMCEQLEADIHRIWDNIRSHAPVLS
jgi:hypothetical protein